MNSAPHCIVVTHTHERIARTLMGVARQSLPAASITIAADSDDERITREVQCAVDRTGVPMRLVLRARCNESRRAQNRNNAVRALLASGAGKDSAIIFYDGDCIPEFNCNRAHLATLARRDISLGWAVRLSQEQTDEISEEQILAGEIGSLMSTRQTSDAISVDRRTRKRIFLRRFGLTKPHKPGILSGNFSLGLDRFLAVNGFDESFTGWGAEDDDIARRLYMLGSKPGSSMRTATVFHQHHPSEAPADWSEAPNSDRLARPTQRWAALGIDRPAEQPEPIIQEITPGAKR